MAKNKQPQVPLVSADGSTPQPPFPGGWVLALFDVLESFLGPDPSPAVSRRTKTRLRKAEEITRKLHKKLEEKLTTQLSQLFPLVAPINGFAGKYCTEYFQCWTVAGEIAPSWTHAFGYEPAHTAVIARALMRDLALRLAYLESCNRALAHDASLTKPQALFRANGPCSFYRFKMEKMQAVYGSSKEDTARELGTNARQFHRIRTGEAPPTWALLQEMADAEDDLRLVAAVGFSDAMLHKLELNDGVLGADLFSMAEAFFPAHAFALADFEKKVGPLEAWAKQADNLLLHPGFARTWPKMPTALWRAHLYSLQYGRMPDLAHAYVQCGEEENERNLSRFFEDAEKKSNGSPHAWMDALRVRNPLVKFSPDIAPAGPITPRSK